MILGETMLAGRFDNYSVADLIERETEARLESDAIVEALKSHLIAECPVQIGMVYSFKADLMGRFGKPSHLRGKRFLVGYLHADRPRWSSDQWCVLVQGFISNPRSTVGDGFNRKNFVMRGWDAIDLDSAAPGPRQFNNS